MSEYETVWSGSTWRDALVVVPCPPVSPEERSLARERRRCTGESRRSEAVKQAILASLQAGPLEIKPLKKATGRSEDTVRRVLVWLEESGEVVRQKRNEQGRTFGGATWIYALAESEVAA